MKRKFALQSAPPRRGLGEGGFFNARLIIGLFVAITGALLALADLDVLSAPAAPLAHSGYRAPVANGVPRPDHVVIVIEENHSYSEIIGSSAAPYINSLAALGALFTQSYATTHPSKPNYLHLFSGSNQGVTNDSCPHSFSTANLWRYLLDASLTFAGYSEDLPSVGSPVCTSGGYARKHAPWVNFTNIPTATNPLIRDTQPI